MKTSNKLAGICFILMMVLTFGWSLFVNCTKAGQKYTYLKIEK